jgi:cell wall-associated NlpC family hydrolase
MTIDDLVGKPYRLGGRGPDAYDCAGLVVELMRRRGISLAVPETTASPARNIISMLEIIRSVWVGKQHPQRGCLVFLKPDHVGVMLNRRQFIHAAEDLGQVCVEYVDNGLWKQRVGGFYEYSGGTQ